ncbi:hypothetical protein DNTS_014053 [Danionella cerebrum]|uniref:Uncharacterized protein n=1 Tax=Danionella cerebrum TaxID=2873325 RepID=A0A553NIH0_9TELE|nr:hypothetical protein DNTS_014053 [Danionella translucida]
MGICGSKSSKVGTSLPNTTGYGACSTTPTAKRSGLGCAGPPSQNQTLDQALLSDQAAPYPPMLSAHVTMIQTPRGLQMAKLDLSPPARTSSSSCDSVTADGKQAESRTNREGIFLKELQQIRREVERLTGENGRNQLFNKHFLSPTSRLVNYVNSGGWGNWHFLTIVLVVERERDKTVVHCPMSSLASSVPLTLALRWPLKCLPSSQLNLWNLRALWLLSGLYLLPKLPDVKEAGREGAVLEDHLCAGGVQMLHVQTGNGFTCRASSAGAPVVLDEPEEKDHETISG